MSSDAETRLLVEGATTYVGALNAVRAFKDLIQGRYRQVVLNRLTEYSAALGRELTPEAILNWTSPTNWSETEATIGTYIKIGQVSSIFHMVYLTADETPPEVAASIYLDTKAKRDVFWDALSPHEPALVKLPGSREIWLGEQVPALDFGKFDKKFDELLSRWIGLWKKVGGLKRISELAAAEQE